MKIGIFYGSSTCYTEMVAEKIHAILGADNVDVHNIRDIPLARMADYDLLLCGIPTWDFGELQEDWENRWPEIDSLDLSQKPVALFGLGDQLGYGEWFQDALGYLHNVLVARGAQPVGYWPNQGYEFETSKALTDDKSHFVGLALDDTNQYDQTDARLTTWIAQIMDEITAL